MGRWNINLIQIVFRCSPLSLHINWFWANGQVIAILFWIFSPFALLTRSYMFSFISVCSFFGHQKEIINTLPPNYRHEWRIQHTKSRRSERAKKRTLTISQCFIWLVDMMTTKHKKANGKTFSIQWQKNKSQHTHTLSQEWQVHIGCWFGDTTN